MKVKLVTQVLSHTVSAAMLMAVSSNLLPPSAAGTAEFVAKFDEIFDCLNSSSFKSPKPHNRPITGQMCSFVKSNSVKNPINGKDVTNILKYF
jgi:hypothetical protein